MDLRVKNNKERQKFVAWVNNKLCVLDYEKVDNNKLDYKSTFVPEDLRHKGIGHQLVEEALDYAKEHDYKVKPSCPFVKSFVEENQDEYAEVVA